MKVNYAFLKGILIFQMH